MPEEGKGCLGGVGIVSEMAPVVQKLFCWVVRPTLQGVGGLEGGGGAGRRGAGVEYTALVVDAV